MTALILGILVVVVGTACAALWIAFERVRGEIPPMQDSLHRLRRDVRPAVVRVRDAAEELRRR